MKNYLYTLWLLLLFLPAKAQLNSTFTHYSQENGLSENTVMSIVQDHDGMLWFATWDGINRFDGYDFHVYKARKSNDVNWASNRIDYLYVDAQGDIWCIAYDGHAFRFDKRMETFIEVPAEDSDKDLVYTSIEPLANGTVWLLTDDNGGMRVRTEAHTGKILSERWLSATASNQATRINAVFLDSKGNEWLLTGNGLQRISPEGKRNVYFTDTENNWSSQPFFAAIQQGECLYFTSRQGRIWTYSLKDDTFTLHELPYPDDISHISTLPDKRLALTMKHQGVLLTDSLLHPLRFYGSTKEVDFNQSPIQNTYIDRYGEIWIAIDRIGCVCHINPYTETFRFEQMKVEQDAADRSVPVFAICEDSYGNVWVHPVGGGLAWFDRTHNKLLPFYDEAGSPDWRFSNKLHAMTVDRQGNLWLGTHSKGLEKISFFNNRFHLIKPLSCNYDTNANQVRALCEDSEGRIWTGTRDGKISVYSAEFELIGHLTSDGHISATGTPLIASAYQIIEDSKGIIWIASKGNGIFRLAPTSSDRSYHLANYTYDANDIYSLSHNSAYDICEDSHGRLWIATFGGGVNCMEQQADGSYRFLNARNNLKAYPIGRCSKARAIQRDKNGTLWAATSNGLLSFNENFTRAEAIDFKLHIREPNNKESLNNNDIYDILLTHEGRLFFATFGGGLNELKATGIQDSVRFTSYTTSNGLPTDVLVSLCEDRKGNIWIGTESGLSRMNANSLHFDNFLKGELGEELIFEESTALTRADGILLFGSNRGLLTFNPADIQTNRYVPSIVFCGLKIANENITPQEGSVLPESLNTLKHLTLSHKSNTISLAFAALDMNAPENIKYAYMLDGFDEEWNYVGKQRIATYTNLPHGKYTFRIRSTNGAGIWVDNERQLTITVRPTFWETPYAFILYTFIFLCILLGGAYILFTIYRLKHEVSVEQQVTDMKLRFFTNISHELRTPLTLIEGPISYVLKQTGLSQEVREQLQTVERNTNRMLRLVNQILDFRKIQNNKMKLCVEQIDIVAFARKIMENFESVAESNRIDFIFESEQPSLKLWADADKVEKILFNLLSNAFKYTEPGKAITVFIHENENTIAIGVQDQGIGIPENRKESLFVRFETLLDKNIFNKNSTGIGLSLVKELTDMHHASIRVDSKEGEGSCFTVEFKKGKEHYGEEVEFILSDNIENGRLEPADLPNPDEEITECRNTMLLVEDNLELRSFLRTIFKSQFQIIEAANGAEGIDKAKKHMPDIIISDIMMPEQDGIALTKELRNDVATSHIPIVLLTAKTDMDSKLQGMELGIDSYITKPFSAVYLKARVDNLLARRQRLRQFYCEHLMDTNDTSTEEAKVEEEVQSSLSPQDKRFIDRLTEFMEKNMDNGDLVVDDLVSQMAVSRSVFFKKLKSLTGLSPIEFIKEVRVKRAAQLIETGEFNMTQITYMVGFNDPRYFSKCFKQRFGMRPTEYRDKIWKKSGGGTVTDIESLTHQMNHDEKS